MCESLNKYASVSGNVFTDNQVSTSMKSQMLIKNQLVMLLALLLAHQRRSCIPDAPSPIPSVRCASIQVSGPDPILMECSNMGCSSLHILQACDT